VSDIHTVAMDSLIALDPNRPIREADIDAHAEQWLLRGVKRTSQIRALVSANDPKRTSVIRSNQPHLQVALNARTILSRRRGGHRNRP